MGLGEWALKLECKQRAGPGPQRAGPGLQKLRSVLSSSHDPLVFSIQIKTVEW